MLAFHIWWIYYSIIPTREWSRAVTPETITKKPQDGHTSSIAISTPSEFCRACRGTGGGYECNGHGGSVFVSCHYCGGTGNQSVTLTAHREVSA